MGGQVEETIRSKLTSSLQPTHLSILNESYMHNVPKGSETHFKVIVVSDKFDNSTLIQVYPTTPADFRIGYVNTF